MYMHLCSSKNEAPHIFANEKIKNENPNVLHKQIKTLLKNRNKQKPQPKNATAKTHN